MKTIKPAELQNLLAAQPDVSVLDVRTPVEFAEAHVPQAHNVPLDRLDPASFLELREPVYLLCRSGGRATKAAEKFSGPGSIMPSSSRAARWRGSRPASPSIAAR